MSQKSLIVCLLFLAVSSLHALPRTTSEDEDDFQSTTETANDTGIPQDLYVIKTVVYEVGILTDPSNDTDNLNTTHDEVDLTFFNPSRNGSAIDLSTIPLPIQTNVSGFSVTGLLPGANLASFLGNSSGNNSQLLPILPQKQITVTQNISTRNPEKGSEIISNLPKILGLVHTNDSQKIAKNDKSNENDD